MKQIKMSEQKESIFAELNKDDLLSGVPIPRVKEDIKLFVTYDGLEAFIIYNDDLSPELFKIIRDFLNETPVKFGIMEEPERRDDAIIFAKGKPPVKGKDARVIFKKPRYFIKTYQELTNIIKENGFLCYEKDELIAEKTEPTEGIPGIDVFNNVIPAPKGKWVTFPIGKGVFITEDNKYLKAFYDGKLEIQEGKIHLLDVVKYQGGINHTTGNLVFKGKLLEITESVEHGFSLEVKGDLIVGNSIENATVNVDGNATVKGLILGENSQVYVNGNLDCNIIENAKIVVEGDLIVKNYMIDSDCFVRGNITVTQKKGLILGGKTVAFNTIKVNDVGSELQTTTEIYVGFLEEYLEKLKALKIEYTKNYSKLNDVKKGIDKLCEIEGKKELDNKTKGIKENLIKAEKDLSAKLDDMFKEIDIMQKKIDEAPEPKFTVLRKVYPGVTININNHKLIVKEVLFNKTFRYSDNQVLAVRATR